MKEQQAVAKVIELARSQLGYREGANNYNKYAADLDPLGITWGSKQNQPWCAEFILWLFVESFGANEALEMLCSPRPTGIPLCSAGAGYFQSAGRWFETPEPGDVVFFLSGGEIGHEGLVTEINGSRIVTVEGNFGDSVAEGHYAADANNIAGFGRPRWAVVTGEEDAAGSSAPSDEIRLPMLRRGDRGEVVRSAQLLLNGHDCSCGKWGADGDFGPATEAAVLAFQRRNGLSADGIVGVQTWTALLGLSG